MSAARSAPRVTRAQRSKRRRTSGRSAARRLARRTTSPARNRPTLPCGRKLPSTPSPCSPTLSCARKRTMRPHCSTPEKRILRRPSVRTCRRAPATCVLRPVRVTPDHRPAPATRAQRPVRVTRVRHRVRAMRVRRQARRQVRVMRAPAPHLFSRVQCRRGLRHRRTRSIWRGRAVRTRPRHRATPTIRGSIRAGAGRMLNMRRVFGLRSCLSGGFQLAPASR
mmetsp:Transcript_105517/g.303433  ORF Transcript_105517/g.303433 Transcript_105517/m.303433 type:complete len:223 (+) Transcript_105517:305-973(+)